MNEDDERGDAAPQTPKSTNERNEVPSAAPVDSPHSLGSEPDDVAPSEADTTAADAKRDKRSRTKMLKRLLDEFGIDEAMSADLVRHLNDLLPPQHRMSTGKDVADRLADMFESDNKAPVDLLFTTSGKTPLDVTDTERSIRDNSRLEKLLDDEEGLYRALIANERVRAGLARWVAEHDAIRRIISTELERRHTLAEQWRYLLPKFVLPVFSVLHAAGATRDELRVGGPLLKSIVDLIVAHRTGKVDAETLYAAAEQTEQQFEEILLNDLVAKGPDEGPVPESGVSSPEKFGVAIERLRAGNVQDIKIEDRMFLTSDMVKYHVRLMQDWSLGIDSQGRPVFRSIDHLTAVMRHLTQQHGLTLPKFDDCKTPHISGFLNFGSLGFPKAVTKDT